VPAQRGQSFLAIVRNDNSKILPFQNAFDMRGLRGAILGNQDLHATPG